MKHLRRLVCLYLTAAIFSSCGGSGNGSVSYTGLTTEATVTTANALSLSTNAYESGNFGSSANIAAVETTGAPIAAGQNLPKVGMLLQTAVGRALSGTPGVPAATSAGVMVQQAISGAYSGSASYKLDANVSSGEFSGSVTFNNYKDNVSDPAVNGTVTASGVYNMGSQTFSSLSISFYPMTVTEGTSSVSLFGTMSITQGATSTLTFDCLVRTSGGVYRVKNWTFSLNASNQLTVNGTYYDPAYGYVTIATPAPLTVTSLTGDPTAGEIDFIGANGTKATMTFNATGYEVSVHTAGNTDYNWVNGRWQTTP